MALIQCPECGRENVSDTADACPNCGYGIKAHFIKQREEEKQKKIEEEERKRKIERERLKLERAKILKKKANKIIWKLVLVIITVTITIVGVYTYSQRVKENKIKKAKEEAREASYRDAINTFETGDYKKALYDFMVLDDYKDSEEYIEKCEVNIPVKKYYNKNYVQAYKELISLSPEAFERVMSDSTISLSDMIYDCRKNCAELGHIAYTDKKYRVAANYFDICYEYDSVSYEDEYLFTKKLSTMKTFWYYFKAGEEVWDGFFYIEDDIWTLGIDTLRVPEGHYDYESKDGAVYIPDLDIYIYPPISEDAGSLAVKFGDARYTFTFYDDQNYMKKKIAENNRNAPKDPAIGMNAAEVEASTWGKPKSIHKTTYEWGTVEQWVYSGNRYIYFDNGRVSAISE